jgi:hypothetical protein
VNEAQVTKTTPDYMGNSQYTVAIDGLKVGTVRHIKRNNLRIFSSYMTADRAWVASGLSTIHFTSRANAVEALIQHVNR